MDNILLLSDSYKVTHFVQYPPGTTEVYSYFESRGGKWDEVCFFGLQYLVKRYLVGQVVTQAKIDQAEQYFKKHLPNFAFNRAGWEYILHKHNGHLPLSIRAVPEGSVVPTRNVLMTVVNTDPSCFWLTNYVETLLVQVWYPMTVCTNSREQKKVLKHFLQKTGGEVGIAFKLHDFGFRGVSSVETAGIGGAAHLVNFLGTDTMAALVVADEYYGEECAGFSIPASEHSTITSWGMEGEQQAMANMLEQYPSGLMACVSDSFNVFKACKEIWGGALRDKVLQRDGVLVVRPDSGKPSEVVLKCLNILGDAFGTAKNPQGYKVLDSHVRVIQGDGVDIDSLREILATMEQEGWSAENIAFGSGGALLQKLNRDTLKCAFKCSSIVVNGKRRDVFKDPITDPGKASKKGRLRLVRDKDGRYATVQENGDALGNGHNGCNARNGCKALEQDVLVEVFRDGKLLVESSFGDIRERAQLP